MKGDRIPGYWPMMIFLAVAFVFIVLMAFPETP